MQATAPTAPGAKMTIRVYRMDREGTVIEDRGTVSILHGQDLPPSTPFPPCACRHCRGEQPDPVCATLAEGEVPTLDTVSMRVMATWFLDQPMLPRHGTVKLFDRDFRRFLGLLIPHIEQFIGGHPMDDVPARVALAGVGEARRRLAEIESAGLLSEVERVKRLARSVVGLCDHFDALTGITMCLACDKRIEDVEESVPYDSVSPLRGARSGQVHARCSDAVRHR
jgi:hypothetical protein